MVITRTKTIELNIKEEDLFTNLFESLLEEEIGDFCEFRVEDLTKSEKAKIMKYIGNRFIEVAEDMIQYDN